MVTRAGWNATVGLKLLPRDGRRVKAALIESLPSDQYGDVIVTDMSGKCARRVAFCYLSDRYEPAKKQG